MLYMSLGVSAVMLVVVNLIVRRASYPVPLAAIVCLITPFVPFCGLIFYPAAARSALYVGVLLVVVFIPRYGRRLYLPLSVVATIVVYVVVGRPAAEQYRETVKLQQQYPFESLEKRLPPRPKPDPSWWANTNRLGAFEQAVENFEKDERAKKALEAPPTPTEWGYRPNRTESLRIIHEHAVNDFTNSPGFGVMRGLPAQVSTKTLDDGGHGSPPVQQPDYAATFVHPPLELSKELPKDDGPKLLDLHSLGVLDFVNPKGFGYVKDRGRVAGFQPHGMSKVPAAATWDVARIELIGVVVHAKPVVYQSQNLPRMEDLRDAHTRPLDAFETAGLESLRKGEDLYARGTANAARMVGAIRATKQCTTCHGCDRGELLGAFSYGLRR